jgi:RNA polymerase sigma-70 factor (ECF subfamily)
MFESMTVNPPVRALVFFRASRTPRSDFTPEDVGKGGTMLATLRIDATIRSNCLDAHYDELATLVRQAQKGDRAAFGELVEQFQGTVHAICLRRLGNPSEALELTQEVFLHVMRRIDQLREPERFAGWLRQVTVRMAINRATRRTSPPSVEVGVLEAASERRDDPLTAMIARERAERLWEGLDRLKPLDRETLVAFYIRGQSLVEMADLHDAPLGTIKRRLHTARKRLKAELESTSKDAEEWSEDHEYESDLDGDLHEPRSVTAVGA